MILGKDWSYVKKFYYNIWHVSVLIPIHSSFSQFHLISNWHDDNEEMNS